MLPFEARVCVWLCLLSEIHSHIRLFRCNSFSTYFVCVNLGLKCTLVVFATSSSAQHTLSVPSWSLHSNLTLTQIDLASKIQYDEPADKTGRFLFSPLPMIMLRPLCTPRMIAVDRDGRKLTFFFSPPSFALFASPGKTQVAFVVPHLPPQCTGVSCTPNL